MRPRGVGALQPAFVGRDHEVGELRLRYGEVVASGRPQLVLLTGEAGVGKTRVVRELWAWLGGQDPPPLRRGPMPVVWERNDRLAARGGAARTLRYRGGGCAAVVRERLGDRTSLALTLGVDTGSDLHPLVARERLHDAWVAFLSELATKGPTVVLVEDVHWADDELLDLLDTLVEQVDGPLLMLATARPELLTVGLPGQDDAAPLKRCVGGAS